MFTKLLESARTDPIPYESAQVNVDVYDRAWPLSFKNDGFIFVATYGALDALIKNEWSFTW